jgi:hypothetical protein
MSNKKNSKRFYYLIRLAGILFYIFYFNKINCLIYAFFQKLEAAVGEIFHLIGLILFGLVIIFFTINVIAFCFWLLGLFRRIKVSISSVMDKLKLFLLLKLKNVLDTFSEKNRNRLYLIYYSITITSPTSIFCYFFQNEILKELCELLCDVLLTVFYFDPSLIPYAASVYSYFYL